jgi:hypothetical protein
MKKNPTFNIIPNTRNPKKIAREREVNRERYSDLPGKCKKKKKSGNEREREESWEEGKKKKSSKIIHFL